MQVENVMSAATICCGLQDSLESVVYQMWNGDVGAVPVLNEQGMPVGIITDRDIAMALGLRHVSPAQLCARDLLDAPLVSCSPRWDVRQALKLMAKERIRRLVVVDDQHHMVGMLSLCDVAAVAGNGRKKSDVSLTELVEAMRLIATPHTVSEAPAVTADA